MQQARWQENLIREVAEIRKTLNELEAVINEMQAAKREQERIIDYNEFPPSKL